MMRPNSLVLLLIALTKINSNSALTCYECSQPKGAGLACEVNVESVPQTVCPVGFSCTKYVWTNVGSSIIHRHCTSLGCEQLRQNSTQFHTLETCETCDTDLCNKASFTQISLLLIITLSVLSQLM